MATNREKRAFPTLSAGNWWELRRRFQRSLPSQVSPTYLQTVLGTGEKAAKNALPQLKTVGLVDNDGRPTPRANDWRTDEGYKVACEEILEDVYPAELREAVPPSHPERDAAQRWFMRQGVGATSARMMAAFYALLAEADPSAADQVRREPTVRPVPARRPGRTD